MAGRMRAALLEPGMVVSSMGRAEQRFSHERVAAIDRIPGFTEKRRLRFASGRVADAYFVQLLQDANGTPPS